MKTGISIILGILSAFIFLIFLNQLAYGYAVGDVPCFTYFKDVGTNFSVECITWDHTHLTYHITNEIEPEYSDYYRWAFGTWQYYTNDLITFSEVSQAHNANIQVKILKELEMCPGALGCTELQHNEGKFTNIYIYASKKECQYDTFTSCVDIPDRKFWLAAQHEVGHSVGLNHVQDNLIEPIDTMHFKVESGLTIVSKDDLWKLQEMYKKPIMVEMKNAPYSMFEDKVQFVPDRITVKVGDTITWINRDDTGLDRNPHTVTSGTPQGEWGVDFDSGNKAMQPDDSFSVTFDEKGEYSYLCRLHPWMLGKIIVS